MKNQLRQKSKIIRKNLNCENASKKILEKILSWEEFKSAQNIMIYHPINNEINLLWLCTSCKKNFYLPKISNNEIVPVFFDENTPLVCGKYNIQEPVRKCSDSALNLDIVFIPAVCADKSGYRIGYGKGYYDRFLGKLHEKTKTAIVIYEELLCEKIPAESFDRKANFVITPEKIIKC